MKSLNIILLEDNIEDAQLTLDSLADDYSIKLVDSLQKAKSALTSSPVDLAIIDISIDGKLDGIEFAKHIQTSINPIPFLFLTSIQSKTVFDQAKLTKPFTYLIKPFNSLELSYSIELAIEKGFEQENTLRFNKPLLTPDYLLIKSQNIISKINIENVEYVQVENNYCTLFTSDKKYVVKKSLSKIKELLAYHNFEQVHRNYLVNFNKIRELNIQENTIYLTSNFQVSVSERYKKSLIKHLDIMM